jgi:hypothetical protein
MSIFEKIWARFLVGALLVILLLGGVFALLPGWMDTYGAAPQEIAAVYPGDELLTEPAIQWTHAVSISAPVEKVWPWIAQIGQSRGGFYSYTFIENLISGDNSFQNASQILSQFQDPQPGEFIITDMLPIKEISTGNYFLAATVDFFGVGWTWLWYLKPVEPDATRLIIRMKVQTPGELINPVGMVFFDAGAFVMEKCMLQGLEDRAEGRAFPVPIEPLEIFAWVGTLLVGLVAIWQVMKRKDWLLPLIIGLLSVIALLVFTFLQPSIYLRIAILAMFCFSYWISFFGKGIRR